MVFAKVLIFPDIFKNIKEIPDYWYFAAKTASYDIERVKLSTYNIKADFENLCWVWKLEAWAFERMEMKDDFKCANFLFYFT